MKEIVKTGPICEAMAQPQSDRVQTIKSGHPRDRRSVADNLFPDIIWKDETTGFITCPGVDGHTGKQGPKDCQVKIDGVPTVYCVHASCEEEIKEANRALRSGEGQEGAGGIDQGQGQEVLVQYPESVCVALR